MSFDDEYIFPKLSCLPPFYREVLLCFNKAKKKVVQIEDEIIWGNKAIITSNNKKGSQKRPTYFKNWIDSGIIFVKNILFNNIQIDEQFIHEKVQN